MIYRFRLSDLLNFYIALIALNSMFAWFLLKLDQFLYVVTFFLIGCLLAKRHSMSYSVSAMLSVIFYFIYSYRVTDYQNVTQILGSSARVVLFAFILFSLRSYRASLFNSLVKVYIFIVALGLPFWTLNIAGLSIPYFEWSHSATGSSFNNHIFYLSFPNVDGGRYMSVFLEPGHMSMISALMLYPLRYRINDVRVKFLLFSILVSFSAAGFVLVIIGYIVYVVIETWSVERVFRQSEVYSVLLSVLLVTLVMLWVESSIVEKLFASVTRGNFMDFRLSSDFKRFYESSDWTTLLNGIGERSYQELFYKGGSAGYKVFIVKYGLINLALLGLVYGAVAVAIGGWQSLGYLILICLSFTQRAYAMWEIQIFLFVAGLSLMRAGSVEKNFATRGPGFSRRVELSGVTK